MRSRTFLLVGLAAAWVGCQGEPAAVPEASAPADDAANVGNDSPAGPLTFVSLKVPNMV